MPDTSGRGLTPQAGESFPGMLAERDVHVVFVSGAEPLGYTAEPPVTRKVRYTGSEVVVVAPSAVDGMMTP